MMQLLAICMSCFQMSFAHVHNQAFTLQHSILKVIAVAVRRQVNEAP